MNHDNLRDNVGQAIADKLVEMTDGGKEMFDVFDSRNIDVIADAVMTVVSDTGAAPDLMSVVEQILDIGHLNQEDLARLRAAWYASVPGVIEPIDMVLYCPKCGKQHIDYSEADAGGAEDAWDNPPHRSHKCHGCGHIWRQADVPTNGVAAVKTKGKADSPIAATPASPTQPTAAQASSPLGRDADWVLAMGKALGLDSGYSVPIVPDVEAFRRLFAALRAQPQAAQAAIQLWGRTNEMGREGILARGSAAEMLAKYRELRAAGEAVWLKLADDAPICDQPQAAQAVPQTLRGCIDALIDKHGTLRAVSRETKVDVGYLSRLHSGEKDDPSDETLSKLGITRCVVYTLASPTTKAAGEQSEGGKA